MLRQTYVDQTRQALLDAGLRIFAERPYADVSAEELVRAAGLTRGALYHHFNGKQGLFEAIFNSLELAAAERIRDAIGSVSDPFKRIDRGVAEFFTICTDPAYQHVVMLQGPIALGWQRWRELDQSHLGGVVLDAIQALQDQQLITDRHPTEFIARALFGILAELCMTLAESDRPAESQRLAEALVRDLIHGLRPKN